MVTSWDRVGAYYLEDNSNNLQSVLFSEFLIQYSQSIDDTFLFITVTLDDVEKLQISDSDMVSDAFREGDPSEELDEFFGFWDGSGSVVD